MFIDETTLEYPIDEATLRARFPLISFPLPFEPPAGFARVQLAEPPAFDRMTKAVVEGAPMPVSGGFVQSWVLRDLSTEEVAERAAAVRKALKAAVTDARWRAEVGGIELPNGMRVRTGIDDQNRINSVLANAPRSGMTSVRFKGDGDVWVDLPIATLEQIAVAVALHVQDCFMSESAHHDAIDALQDFELGSYNVATGWPGLMRS